MIQVTIGTGNRVGKVVFTLRGSALTLGDLVALWGRPAISLYGESANLRWRNRHITAVPQAYRRHFSFWHPIVYVTFEAGD